MRYIQNNVPAPSRKDVFVYNDFTGGINNTTSDVLIADNELTDADNMIIDKEGILGTRHGVADFDGVKDSDTEFVPTLPFFDRMYVDNVEVLLTQTIKIGDASSTIKFGDETITGKPVDIKQGVNVAEGYYYVDGEDYRVLRKVTNINDSALHQVINGTWVDGYHDFTIIATKAGSVELDISFVTGVWYYDFNTMEAWYSPCVNELDDEFKGVNFIPSNPDVIINSKGRMYIAGDSDDVNNVFIGDLENPFYFPVGLSLRTPSNGDRVVSLTEFDTNIVVGRSRDVYVIYGNTNRTDLNSDVYYMKRFTTHTGVANNKCIDEVNNYLFYIGSDGKAYGMRTTRTDGDYLTTTIISDKIDFTKEPFNHSLTEVRGAKTAYDGENWYVNIGDNVFIYNYINRAWLRWSGFTSNKIMHYKDKIIFDTYDGNGISKTCSISCFGDEGYLDLGMPYISYFASKMFDLGDPTRIKQFRNIYVTAFVYNSYKSSIRMKFEIDFVSVKSVVTIKNDASKWNTIKFGERLISKDIIESLPIVIGQRGKMIRFIYSGGYEAHYGIPPANLWFTGTIYYDQTVDKFLQYDGSVWNSIPIENIEQPFKIYNVTGEYNTRGRR